MTESWALVTGGSGGIGSAVCALLARRGIRPVVGYHRQVQLAEALAARFNGEALHVDLERCEPLGRVGEKLRDRNLIGVVLNACAPPVIRPWQEFTPEMFERQWTGGVVGNHALLAGLVADCFRPKRSGAVVAVLSQAAGGPGHTAPRMMPYVAAKAGLRALLEALAAEVKWLKIATVSPDYTDTPMLRVFEPRMVELLREQGKIASPQDVAAEIVSKLID